jgi:hypothetical protein
MVIIYLISVVFLLLFIFTSLFLYNDFRTYKKDNSNFTFNKYLSSQRGKNYIQSLGLISSISFGIIAIVFSAVYSGLTYEQVKISKDNFLMQINPVIKIESIKKTNGTSNEEYGGYEIIGFVIKNKGINDIRNINIYEHLFTYKTNDTNDNYYESVSFSYGKKNQPNYVINDLKANDSVIIYFDTLIFSGYKRFILHYNKLYSNLEGAMLFSITFNRLPDLKLFKESQYLFSDWQCVLNDGKITDSIFVFTDEKDSKYIKGIDSLIKCNFVSEF